jgi:fatty acid CoA ligase FadD9
MAAEPDLRASLPALETFRAVVDRPTSIEIVQRAAETYADRPALGARRHELVEDAATGQRVARALPALYTLSYRELWARVACLASGLARDGVAAPGQRVALVGSSTIDHVVAELACHYLAAASVPLARNTPPGELEQIVGECECVALFCHLEQLAQAARSLARCPTLRALIAIDVVAGDERHRDILARASEIAREVRPDVSIATVSELEARGARSGVAPPVIPAPGSDPLLSLVYTSGSTGAPKGAMFHERSWHARWSTLPFLELAELPMVSVVFLPQSHMGGRNAVANSLKLGGLAYFTHQSDMSTLFEDLRLVRPTYLHLVPRLSELVYQHFQSEVAHRARARGAAPADPAVAQAVMAEMRSSFLGDRILLALTASAPTPPAVSAFIKECFEIPIVDVFAGTEYGQIFIDGQVNRHNVLALKLVSVPELGYLDTDLPYPRGELYVKTARGIASYFKNEAATRALLDPDGFMRTGDIFEQRGPDHMVWIDRKNNVQKLAQGEFVNLWKLEALFASGSRFVHQVYLQGAATRPYLLAVIVPELAEVAAEVGGAVSDDAIRALLHRELRRLAAAHALAPYEIPRDFVIEREPFSRQNGLLTSLNKPARPRLKERYGAAIEGLYEELDRRAAEAAGGAADATAPIGERVRRTIAAILGLPDAVVDPAQSLRSVGADSIAATSVCAALLREYGVHISVGFVLGPQTSLGAIGAAVEAGQGQARAHAAGPTVTYARIHGADPQVIRACDLRVERLVPGAPPPAAAAPLDAEVTGDVLLTGATGFLGRFLCLELLERAARSGGCVHCVVRARSDADAAQRLAAVYRPGSALHARFTALAAGRLRVTAGDLERPELGWPRERFGQVAREVGAIVHAAALVNHALPYSQLFEANVLGTASVLQLAVTDRPKRLSFISTNSVSLALLGDRPRALERDDTRALGDGWRATAGRHANGYQLSKWAGEVLAQDLSESYGLPVQVFRCNLILPPAGAREQVSPDDFLTRLVGSVALTGLAPRSFYAGDAAPHLDGLPVDFIAAAIAAIGACPARGYAVYHVNNVHWSDGVSLDTVIDRLSAAGYAVERIADHAEWIARFERALRALDPRQQAASSLPIIDQWRQPLAMERRRRVDASGFQAKVAELRPQGLGEIPQLDDGYFDRWIEDLQRGGWVATPGAAR